MNLYGLIINITDVRSTYDLSNIDVIIVAKVASGIVYIHTSKP